MGLLEDALRDTFSSQVAAPPVIDGVADRAIRSGRPSAPPPDDSRLRRRPR